MKEEEMVYLCEFIKLGKIEGELIDFSYRWKFLGLDVKEIDTVRETVTKWRNHIRKKFTIE